MPSTTDLFAGGTITLGFLALIAAAGKAGS